MTFARVHDVITLRARRFEHTADGFNRRARKRDVLAHLVHVAAFATEVPLHVDGEHDVVLWTQVAVVGSRLRIRFDVRHGNVGVGGRRSMGWLGDGVATGFFRCLGRSELKRHAKVRAQAVVKLLARERLAAEIDAAGGERFFSMLGQRGRGVHDNLQMSCRRIAQQTTRDLDAVDAQHCGVPSRAGRDIIGSNKKAAPVQERP